MEAVAGQSRLDFTFVGRENHAGTTPMHLRRDAVACAAEWIVEVEREALRVPGLTATVGKVEAKPGAPNVIAGEATLSLDLRHGVDEVRVNSEKTIVALAGDIARRRGLSVRHSAQLLQKTVKMDPSLVGQIENAVRMAGCEPHRMVSGAGHDAMILAEKVPAAMIFLRTPAGISHNPAETVNVEDVAKAIESGLHLLICSRPRQSPKGAHIVHNLGGTRSSQRSNHLLLTPDTFVRAPLPGMKKCTGIVHAAPAVGAAFTQYTAEFESGGELGSTAAQRFIFVLDGSIQVEVEEERRNFVSAATPTCRRA